ncbi:hypothetical protein RMN56_18050 [Micromonospora halotolerans]|uniref:Uncharacterized protein n=1 Tax=Micromonospora halotolerans TaxID=709879 RepID=A0ABY9ZQ47_9ACTN|nr:hypothetical protein [Micromonospora halotolerans]WNM37090.1 hypothetical protein RMN56_18050 [Micromonospora halotolerans]
MSDDAPVTETEVPDATYWSVAEGDWPDVRPSLPAEMVDLLAPPIVVGVARVVATSRMTPPAGADLPAGTPGPVRRGTSTDRPVPVGATTVRLAAAAPSRPAASAPGPFPGAGRHRSAGAERTA